MGGEGRGRGGNRSWGRKNRRGEESDGGKGEVAKREDERMGRERRCTREKDERRWGARVVRRRRWGVGRGIGWKEGRRRRGRGEWQRGR